MVMDRSEDAVLTNNISYMTDERKMIQEVARNFTMKEVLPVANELDPIQGEIPMDLRNKMGERAIKKVRENYSWDEIIPEWESYYRSLI